MNKPYFLRVYKHNGNGTSKEESDLRLVIQGDRRESDGLKKNSSVDFPLEMDLFLQN